MIPKYDEHDTVVLTDGSEGTIVYNYDGKNFEVEIFEEDRTVEVRKVNIKKIKEKR